MIWQLGGLHIVQNNPEPPKLGSLLAKAWGLPIDPYWPKLGGSLLKGTYRVVNNSFLSNGIQRSLKCDHGKEQSPSQKSQ